MSPKFVLSLTMVRFFVFANADEIEELEMLTALAENIDHLRKTRLP
jgi:hypothetical protein